MVINRAAVRLLSGKSTVRILEALTPAEGSFSGRAIARMAGINHQACNTGLKRLAGERIVTVSGAGRSILYSLNRKNVVVKEMIEPLFAAQARIPELLAEDIGKCRLKDVVSVVLFGSVALSEEKPGSDIDILAVIRDKADKSEVAAAIHAREKQFIEGYGGAIAPLIMTESEFRDGFKKGLGIVNSIIRSGRVVSGRDMGDILNER